MSIAKCFSNLNNAELTSMYEGKLEDGLTQDAAAAAAIIEYSKSLSDRNNKLREKLGLPVLKGPNTKALQELVDNPSETIGSMAEDLYITTEPDVDTTAAPPDVEVDESKITFTHRLVDGRLTDSYMDALSSSQEGDPIELGFKIGDEFSPIATTRKTTNRNTVDGFINFMVQAGILNESKVPNMQGDLVFQAAGNTELRQAFTTALLRDQAPAYLGVKGLKQDGFTFEVLDNADDVTIIGKNGQIEVAKKSELDQMSYEQLQDKYGNFTAIITVSEREFAAGREAYRDNTLNIDLAEPTMPEDQLTLRLMNLLNKLGVKVTTLTEYTKKYKMRNGVNPGAKALADIANQVIALGEGSIDSLSEEAAHFINEALPQEMVENVLRNIHKSAEWAEFSEAYRAIYKDEYSEDQLDAVVRREVLGKIIAKVISDPNLQRTTENTTQKNFFRRAYEFVMDFVNSIMEKMTPNYRNELESYKDEVRKLMLQEDIANLVETDNFEDNTFRFYNTGATTRDDIDKLRTSAQSLARKLHDAEKVLLNAGTGSRTNLKELERIQDALNDEKNIESIAAILSVFNTYVKRLDAAIKESEEDESKAFAFSDEENILYQFVKGFGRKGVDEVRTLIPKAKAISLPANHKSYDLMLETANDLSLKMASLESKANLIDSQNVENLVQRTMDKYNIPEQDRELVTVWINKAKHDTNMFHYAFGQLVHAKDGLLNLAGHIFRKMNHEAGVEFYHATKQYQQKLRDLGVSEADIGKFVDGNFILSEWNWNEFTKDMDNIFSDTLAQAMVNDIKRMRDQNAQVINNDELIKRNENMIAKYSEFLTEIGMEGEDVSKLSSEKLQALREAIQSKKLERELPELSPEVQTARKNLEREKVFPPGEEGLQVRPMKEEYYKEYEKKLSDAGVRGTTKQLLSNLMSDIGDIRKKAYTRVGDTVVLDYTTLSESDLTQLKDYQKRRKQLKSYTTPEGYLKTGLSYQLDNEGAMALDESGNPIVIIDTDLEASGSVSQEAYAAIDLNNLDSNGFIYTVDIEDGGADSTATVAGLPGAKASSAVLVAVNAGVSTYTVIINDLLTNAEISAFVGTNPTAVIKFVSEKAKGDQDKSAKLFYDTLTQIDEEQGREAALKFLDANSFLSFSQDFWEGLGSADSLTQRLQRYREDVATDPQEIEDINNIITGLATRSFALKSILKQNSRKTNPAEIDVEEMGPSVRNEVKKIQEALSSDRMAANAILKDFEYADMVREERTVEANSEVNEAYLEELDSAGHLDQDDDSEDIKLSRASAEITFAQQHMTERNAASIATEKLQTRNYKEGYTENFPKFAQEILEKMGKTKEDLRTEPGLLSELWRSMARARVLPYYKRFAPAAYTQFREQLADESKPIVDTLQEKAAEAFVEVNPNYSFFDQQENEMINPEFDREFKGGYRQPSKVKYANPKFAEMFGQIVDGKSTKNDKMYQAYLATLEYNESALEAMNVGENYNKYRLPQIRKGLVERYSNLFKGNVRQNIRNAAMDALKFTEDDMIQGEQIAGDNIKVIPKMYVSELQSPEDVSTELFFSLTMRAKESYLRKAKLRHYGDIMSLQDKILSREMNGKEPDQSNTYKMFKSALDYNIFGIKEVYTKEIKIPIIGTIDIAKIGRLLLRYVKLRNLGLNVVIPATSWLTGDITRKIEAMVGDYIDLDSQAKGRNEFIKIGPDGMKEIGEIDPGAKINALGQYFGAFDLLESFKGSNYNKLFRNLPKSAMMLHAAANYPLYGTTLLGVLHDFRITESGQIMDRNQFKNINNVTNLTPELKKQWKSFDGNPIYKYIIHNGNEVSFDKEGLIKAGLMTKDGVPVDKNNIDQVVADISERIQGKVQYVNSVIDGQIPDNDRVFAQRNFLLSYLMTHRGWLSIALARRFKNRHLNLDTQTVEEGSYRSLGGFFSGLTEEFAGSPGDFIKNFKTQWDKSSEIERRNMKRVGVEFGTLSAIMAIGLLLRFAAEDPENEENTAIQAINYLWFRVSSELSSVQFNIAGQFGEAVESPFVGWDTMKNLLQVTDLLNDEEIKYGSYKGMTNRGRWLTRMVPGAKQYHDLSNINKTYETYKFYNRKNFSNAFIGNLLWNSTIDAKNNNTSQADQARSAEALQYQISDQANRMGLNK